MMEFVSWDDYSQYMGKYTIFQTTNQIVIVVPRNSDGLLSGFQGTIKRTTKWSCPAFLLKIPVRKNETPQFHRLIWIPTGWKWLEATSQAESSWVKQSHLQSGFPTTWRCCTNPWGHSFHSDLQVWLKHMDPKNRKVWHETNKVGPTLKHLETTTENWGHWYQGHFQQGHFLQLGEKSFESSSTSKAFEPITELHRKLLLVVRHVGINTPAFYGVIGGSKQPQVWSMWCSDFTNLKKTVGSDPCCIQSLKLSVSFSSKESSTCWASGGIWGHLRILGRFQAKKKATQNTRRITASTCGSSGVSLVVRRMASAGAGSKLTAALRARRLSSRMPGMANSCGCNASPSHARKNGTLALETWHSQGRFMAKNAEFLSWKQPWNGGFIYAILNAQQIQPAESRLTQPHQTDIPLSLAANCKQHPNRHFFCKHHMVTQSLPSLALLIPKF